MTKHLYLMRHGETLFNVRRKIQGWCDSPLTETGILQAQQAREQLKDIPFDHYYSSTSERCCDTLEIIKQNDLPYVRLKALKERNFGDFEGESEDLNPKFDSGLDYDDLFPHYGGEVFEEVRKRMFQALEEIMKREDHKTILAVSHGGACIAFLSYICDPRIVFEQGGIKNCCILHFTHENDKFTFQELINPLHA